MNKEGYYKHGEQEVNVKGLIINGIYCVKSEKFLNLNV